ncbi:MAG: leucine-rich repeat protein [Mangrovibacterium sp.]|nr:leucine-rich repeat protein [Mangrovibacterium sp.]
MRNLLLLMLLPILMIGCSKDDEPDVVVVTFVQLDRTELELQINGTYKFCVSYSPVNAEKPNYEWSSSNSEIVSVNSEGEVTALTVGEATITLTAKQQNRTLTSSCAISVLPINTTSITLNKTSLELTIGEEETLTYIIEPENATNKDVEWKSTNPEIASVDNGKVIALTVGETTIEVTSKDGKTKTTCTIKVKLLLINVEIPGTLSKFLTDKQKKNTKELAITGTLNSSDYLLFFDMPLLTTLDLSDLSDRTIPASAFSENQNIKRVLLPKNLTSIPKKLFYNTNISTCDIPETVSSIGDYAFYFCRNLTGGLIIPENVVSIGEFSFFNCIGFSGDLIIPDNVLSIGQYAFYHCNGFHGKLVIGGGVKVIGNDVFRDCDGFAGSLTLGNRIEVIGTSAFNGCRFSGSLIIPNSVITIGSAAFHSCSKFSGNLIIGDNVTSISHSAFEGCLGFTGDLVIGKKVTSIDQETFMGCDNFGKVYSKNPTPPMIKENSIPNYRYVGVPSGAKNNYRDAFRWSDILVIEEVDFGTLGY